MPERERAAGADRPLLYFQLTSEQKGQWNPTRRERMEQERPLLWSVSCSLLLPCPLALTPSQHPDKRGPMAPPLVGLAD